MLISLSEIPKSSAKPSAGIQHTTRPSQTLLNIAREKKERNKDRLPFKTAIDRDKQTKENFKKAYRRTERNNLKYREKAQMCSVYKVRGQTGVCRFAWLRGGGRHRGCQETFLDTYSPFVIACKCPFS